MKCFADPGFVNITKSENESLIKECTNRTDHAASKENFLNKFLDLFKGESLTHFPICPGRLSHSTQCHKEDGHQQKKLPIVLNLNYFWSLMATAGTRWCGAGSIAQHYEDLGPEIGTDKCCRDHDHVLIGQYILANKYDPISNLTNPQSYTMYAQASHFYALEGIFNDKQNPCLTTRTSIR